MPAPLAPTTLAPLLEQWARDKVDAPNSPATARQLDASETDLEPCAFGLWIVTVAEGPSATTFHLTASGLVAVDTSGWVAEPCPEGEHDLGAGVSFEDTRTSTDRGTAGARYLSGCARCVAHVERDRQVA
jgi:hypothetical protein